MWFRLGVFASMVVILLLVRLDVNMVGLGQEVGLKGYENLELREVVVERLEDSGMVVIPLLEEYTTLDNRSMGERVKDKELKDSNYKRDLLVTEGDNRCIYYYKEGVSLKYCNEGLEEITLKPDYGVLKGAYKFGSGDLSIYGYKKQKFEHKGLLISVDYITKGEENLVVELKVGTK